jgi:hypothetical protein
MQLYAGLDAKINLKKTVLLGLYLLLVFNVVYM